MKWSSLSAVVLLCLLNGIQCAGPAKTEGCKPLHGVTYDVFARNTKDICLPKEQVIIDVQIMATFTKSVRIYNLAVCPENTLAFFSEAEEQGLTVLLGIYIGQNAKDNEKELKIMETIMKKYSGIISAVVVGSDAIVSGKIGSTSRFAKISNNVDLLIEYIGRVKKTLRKRKWDHPVTTAEGWGVWESEHGQDLVDAVDFICLKINPFEEGIPVECTKREARNCIDAATYANARASGLAKFYSKDVWVCETGWPTSGARCCVGIPLKRFHSRAIPSPVAATTYLGDFIKGARKRPYFISSAFDRDWRRVWSPCARCTEKNLAEYTLGLFDEDRERKSDYRIPKLKCKLPELPETRIAPVKSKSKPPSKPSKPPSKPSKTPAKSTKTKTTTSTKSKSKKVEDRKPESKKTKTPKVDPKDSKDSKKTKKGKV